MTEDEAKSKWCPYKKETEFGSDRCIGSSCMMWQWVYYTERPDLENGHGYCGLAGKP